MVLNVSPVSKAPLNRTAAESRKRGRWESEGERDGGRRVDVCVSSGSDEKEVPSVWRQQTWATTTLTQTHNFSSGRFPSLRSLRAFMKPFKKSWQNIKSPHKVKNKAVFPFDDNCVLLQVVFDLFFSLFYQLWHQRNCLNLGTERHQRNNEEQGKETAAVFSGYLDLKGADSRCRQQSLRESNNPQTQRSDSYSLVNWCLKFACFFSDRQRTDSSSCSPPSASTRDAFRRRTEWRSNAFWQRSEPDTQPL